LYFATTIFDDVYSDKIYYRPEPFYFWVYFAFMNGFWLIVPGCTMSTVPHKPLGLLSLVCLYSSIKASAKAFAVSSGMDNGSWKKQS
jgi:cholestenol Delta-isomerase